MARKQTASSLPVRALPQRQAKRKAETDLLSEGDTKRSKISSVKPISIQQFTGLIRKRRAELKVKTEDRQHEDLKRIENGLTANTSLQLFPEKVWSHIISMLDDPKDLANMWEVDNLFRDLSGGTRICEVLLSQVMNIVPICRNWSSDFKNNEETPMRAVELAQIPNFRNVSRLIRNAVDRWHEDNILRAIKEHDVFIPSFKVAFPDDKEKLNGIWKNFCSGPENACAKRFFLRSLELDICDAATESGTEELLGEFKEKLLSILDVIGNQIWKFAINMNGVPASQSHLLILKLISLMSNLKWIEIQGFERQYWNQEDDANTNAAFPCLGHLERVTFVSSGDNVEMLMSVLQANPHIKTLDLEPVPGNGGNHEFLRRLLNEVWSLPLKLDMLHLGYSCHDEILQPLNNINWSLKSLHFGVEASLSNIFHFVNRLPTLESLSIFIANITVGGDIPLLELPNLSKFKLAFCNEIVDYTTPSNVHLFYSLQFLLNSTKLKTLAWDNQSTNSHDELRVFFNTHKQEGAMIEFLGGHWKLKDSNIWNVFPELDYVQVKLRFMKTVGQDDKYYLDVKEYRKSNVMQYYKDQLAVSDLDSKSNCQWTRKQFLM